LAERSRGVAILLISLELSEIMPLCDRILVMFEGRLVGQGTPETMSEEEIGLLMTGGKRGG